MIATATNKYRDLGAWISVGGWPVFIRNALDPVDPGQDQVRQLRHRTRPRPKLLKTGKVQVLIGQKYFGWGSEPVKMLAGVKAGRPPAKAIVDSGVDVVTAANLDQYVEQWKKWENP